MAHRSQTGWNCSCSGRISNVTRSRQQSMIHVPLGSTSVHRRAAFRQSALTVEAAKNNYKDQDRVRKARTVQVQATDVLAQLLEAPDVKARAQEHVENLTEEFFMVASTYMELARKEGKADMFERMEFCLKIAMEEKQKTLRPEIQLLNKLIATTSSGERREVYALETTSSTLTMNNKYFFGLLARMVSDVEKQPNNQYKIPLMLKLKEIQKETMALAK